jgi:hypothetical protein
MRNTLLLLAFLVWLPTPLAQAKGASKSSSKSWYLGLGSILQNPITTTQSDTGAASLTGQVYLASLNLSTKLISNPGWTLGLSAIYTPLVKSGNDGIKKQMLVVLAPLLFQINTKLSWKLGPGFQFYQVGADGGSLTLANGTGTATFYRPNSYQTSKNFLVATGVEWQMSPSWKLDADLWIPGILTTRRSVNLGVHLNWGVL